MIVIRRKIVSLPTRCRLQRIKATLHWNKTHWSDVYYEEMDEALVEGLIRESYQLIASKLPKAIRQKYIK